MRGYSEHQILRLGAITLVVALLIVAAAFNLSKFPGFGGDSFQAEFKDASGLRKGNMVQVGGIRAGRVQDIELKGDKVLVTFEVDHGVEFGRESRASVQVLNLLGEKYLELTPAGPGQLDTDDVIPVSRTKAAYDIVGVLGDLTDTTARIDIPQLKQALNTVGSTIESSGPELQAAFTGISRLSQSVAGRDAELQTLLEGSASVSEILDDRRNDVVKLVKNADLVFKELRSRKAAVHRLLVNARVLARELRGVVVDNQSEIGPALKEVDDLLNFLTSKEKELKNTLAAYGPYADILGNIIGTGPWFDAYVVNLAGLATGEFSQVGTVN
ncbi:MULTISPECIES: MCE family protein [unclassified Nocardioides]|uniref:MCE family protein n=1 Tax=unclassified Nocardioides TaxID=2615069 RepID=UPI0006FDE4FD|nr:MULTISPECIES: MlaD family protein [unclassified Nocardioides]KQY64140.1 virulence factor Mce family protein [Nocardioides sp. Root140]KQZ70060.1 virulence factor Mce family protein [Nocardioides sp. Root151]KRF16158.1 virulence factor Mce family protein [Nocardioides sp. Soil796]